jgi:hypothetical protein
MLSEACPQRTLLRNNSNGTILPYTRFAFGQEISANYNKGLDMSPFEFNYILNLYILSMCFVR